MHYCIIITSFVHEEIHPNLLTFFEGLHFDFEIKKRQTNSCLQSSMFGETKVTIESLQFKYTVKQIGTEN